MNSGRNGFRCALVIGAGLLTGACAVSGGRGQGMELLPSPHPYEVDIPVPEGFRLAEQSSEDWSSGSLRYLRHRYVGRADKYELRRFYRQQMPLVKWTTLSDGQISGRYTMRFVRGTESCTIAIDGGASTLSSKVVIDVMIAPAAR